MTTRRASLPREGNAWSDRLSSEKIRLSEVRTSRIFFHLIDALDGKNLRTANQEHDATGEKSETSRAKQKCWCNQVSEKFRLRKLIEKP